MRAYQFSNERQQRLVPFYGQYVDQSEEPEQQRQETDQKKPDKEDLEEQKKPNKEKPEPTDQVPEPQAYQERAAY